MNRGCETDVSTGQVDTSRGPTDTPSVSNGAETASLGHNDSAGVYLSIGDVKCGVEVADGIGSHADASSGHGDVPSVETDANTTTSVLEIISTSRMKPKLPDLPSQGIRRAPDEPNGCGSHAEALSVHRDVHNAVNKTKTNENEA